MSIKSEKINIDNLPRDRLPVNLYLAKDVRELDQAAVDSGMPSYCLMQRAGRHVLHILATTYPNVHGITIFCGTGNNGGDGYVLAYEAHIIGIDVEIIQLGDATKIRGDAFEARQQAIQAKINITQFSTILKLQDHHIVVDAMLGTGLSGEVREEYVEAINLVNNSIAQPIISVDIPSGLCSDTGKVLGCAIKADHSVSFIGLKQGLLTGAGPDYVGAIHFSDLLVPDSIFESVKPQSQRLDFSTLATLLPKRTKSAHKGHFGHVWVVGGDYGMAGAVTMSSHAACRVGAGLVSCATRPEHVSAIVSRSPEVMAHGVTSGQEVEPLLKQASVVVLGPGLGQGAWGEQLLQKVMALSVPIVVDADALNILSKSKVVKQPYRDNWILTPHPGEAARLLGCSVLEIQQNRFAAVQKLQERYGGAVILKGVGTLVADNTHPLPGVCVYGNPGMATGGMGDILSGVLGGLLAQGVSPADASRLGVCLHAKAADDAAIKGERGLMATDLLPHLRKWVNVNSSANS